MSIRNNILTVGLIGGLVLYIENVLTFSMSTYTDLILITDIIIIISSLVILKFFSRAKPSYLLAVGVGFITYLISNFILILGRTIFNTVTHFDSIGGYLHIYFGIVWIGLLFNIILAIFIRKGRTGS